MVAVSSGSILRLAAAAAMPYASVERMTRPLIAQDRWVSRKRRDLRASDMASLLNAMLGGGLADAAETDTILRGLEYKSSWPFNTHSAPHFGPSPWGELLEQLIEGVPGIDSVRPAKAELPDSDTKNLPHVIEACLNPLSIQLIWLDHTGARKRVDFYGPNTLENARRAQPYGAASLLVRKSFLMPEMIIIAGDILRDNAVVSLENENAALAGAAPTRNQDQNSIPEADTPENRRESDVSQAPSSRGRGVSRNLQRSSDHDAASPPTC